MGAEKGTASPATARPTVAVVVPKYGLVGGAESFVFELTERIAALEEFEVHVLANRWRRGSGAVFFHKVPIVPFPRWLRPVSFAFFADRLCRRHGFELIHSHERIFSMDLFTFHGIPHAAWIRRTKRNRLSLHDRATAWVERKGMTNERLSAMMPVSHLVREALLETYDIPPQKIEVVHPGVALDRFDLSARSAVRSEIRRRCNLSEQDVVLLFISMNFELKRLDWVLQAVARICGRGADAPPVKVLVVGRGNEKKYRKMARSLNIEDRIVFSGAVARTVPFYLASDIFVLPSRLDTFGMSVLEAMAAGLPVIITGTMGAKDLVESAGCGVVLPAAETPEALADAIAAFLDPDRRRQFGERSRSAAEACDWQTVAARVAAVYRRRIAKSRTRADHGH